MLLNVIIEVTLRAKRARAPGNIAMIGPLSSVDSHVGFEITFFIESASATFLGADELLEAKMSLEMDIESDLSAVGLVASLVVTDE